MLLVAISGVLATLFGSAKSARSAASANAVARDLIESVRQQWSGTAGQLAFDANCIRASVPSGVNLAVYATTSTGALGSALTPSIIPVANACSAGAAGTAGTVKRVIVTTTKNGNELSRLTLDLVRP